MVGMCKLLNFAIVILGLNPYYRRISNNLHILRLFVPPPTPLFIGISSKLHYVIS